jgi:hypothetical protein
LLVAPYLATKEFRCPGRGAEELKLKKTGANGHCSWLKELRKMRQQNSETPCRFFAPYNGFK